MKTVFVFLLAALCPHVVEAQRVQVDVQHFEFDVTEHGETVDGYLSRLEKLSKAKAVGASAEEAARFLDDMLKRKAPLVGSSEVSCKLGIGDRTNASVKTLAQEFSAAVNVSPASSKPLVVSVSTKSSTLEGRGRRVRSSAHDVVLDGAHRRSVYFQGHEERLVGGRESERLAFIVISRMLVDERRLAAGSRAGMNQGILKRPQICQGSGARRTATIGHAGQRDFNGP